MKKLLIVGLPFFPEKYRYMYNAYTNSDVNIMVLINNNSIDNLSIDGLNAENFLFAGKNNLKRIISYFKVLNFFKPKNIDCYDYSIISIIFILIAKLYGINVRFWLIGGELVGDSGNLKKKTYLAKFIINLKLFLTKLCLYFSDTIYAKELHHTKSIEKISSKLLEKVIVIHNCVPVSKVYVKLKKNKDFLYANAVIEGRHVDQLLYSFSELINKNISYTSSIYGFNSISNEVYVKRATEYSDKCLDLYKTLNLSKNVQVHGFIQNIKEIMREYKFFILPGDVILANYALLEAMSLGLVPIVFPGNGYDLIVKDGINGIVAKDFDLTIALKRALLLSDNEYNIMSQEAYSTILKDFSLEIWQKKISANLY